MKVAQFREMLEELRELYTAAGAKSPANDLTALNDALRSADEFEFEDFIDHLRTSLTAGLATVGTSADEHLRVLKEAGIDEVKFHAAFTMLGADRHLKNADLDRIGTEYLEFDGFRRLYKTRTEKLDQIKKFFFERLNFERKGQVIDRLVPWQ